MHEYNTKTMHEIESEGKELAAAGDLFELGDVCDTKGGFGVHLDGHGGLLNPF